ncbi:eukaryotic translation initiation factor 3 subunit K [Centruroides vittatus]|uniref:eukaryotic translation initiation factor 3 subunit K n=1 Tax=Centruroides vittatus TaxID=120091 RepID=UPI00350F37D4
MAEAMRATVASMLRGIDRYNPENLQTLHKYVEIQARENAYDLEANLAVLKLYQFNPQKFQKHVVEQILLKALTNLPHTDFVLCKCLIDQSHFDKSNIKEIIELHDLLEMAKFKEFWEKIATMKDINTINGFEDSIRKFICHIINITYQRVSKSELAVLLGNVEESQLATWMSKYGWKDIGDGMVFVANQEENIKTKNIAEKIDFESTAAIMSSCR